MAGYSRTPLAVKLGIRPGSRVALVGAPKAFEATLEPLPPDVSLSRRLTGRPDVVVFFTRRGADLERRFPELARRMAPDGGLWVAWTKKASGAATDLTEDVVRDVALRGGLVDNKVCAIDDTWSGLRLVYRVRDRPRARA